MSDWDHGHPFTLDIRVTEEDLDELGHVNNATYVRWMEQCAWRHSESLGLALSDYQALDRAMVVLRHEIDYLQAAFAGDDITVATWIVQTDNRLRLNRHFQMRRRSDGHTLLRANSAFVCIELSSGKARKMPTAFIQGYGAAAISSPTHSERGGEDSTTGHEPPSQTLDGRRLGMSELNLPQAGSRSRLRQLLHNLSLFLAGMYTGESCAGTPHAQRPGNTEEASQSTTPQSRQEPLKKR